MAAADSKASGDYTIITRDDGGKQWAYKGKPLYLWVKDAKPGDKTGDGFNNAWRVARPSGARERSLDGGRRSVQRSSRRSCHACGATRER